MTRLASRQQVLQSDDTSHCKKTPRYQVLRSDNKSCNRITRLSTRQTDLQSDEKSHHKKPPGDKSSEQTPSLATRCPGFHPHTQPHAHPPNDPTFPTPSPLLTYTDPPRTHPPTPPSLPSLPAYNYLPPPPPLAGSIGTREGGRDGLGGGGGVAKKGWFVGKRGGVGG